MTRKSEKKSLVIIPCYNEELTIASLIIKASTHVDDVLVIDDGSSDDTSKIAEKAGAIVLNSVRNMGKSAAVKKGFHYALDHGYEYVITMDGDGQHNPDEIPLLLKDLIDNKFDIVLGIRYGNRTEMPAWRKVGKRVLDYATSFGQGGKVTDSQSGFRGFNKKALASITPHLNGNDFAVESEQLIRSYDAKLSLGQTRITCKYKGLKSSKRSPASHGFSVLKYVIWMVAEKHPLLFIGFPGFVSLVTGLLFGIYTLQIYNMTHIFPIHYAILVSILIILGALGLFMGIMLNVLPSIIRRSRIE